MKELALSPEQQEQIEELECAIKKECEKYKGIPVAISGGVDSSTVAAFSKPEFVISVELPGGKKYDETRHAEEVARHLNVERIVVKPDHTLFDSSMTEAVRAIGRPIPHFNIFPLYEMYKKLNEMGVKELILGDGPDESMSGYTRNIIMHYLYGAYGKKGFENYHPMLNAILPHPTIAYADMIKKPLEEVSSLMEDLPLVKGMNQVDIQLMRPDMDDMSNGIAKHFGIKNIRPLQDNYAIDNMMYNLPDELKIHDDLGKIALREIAEKYLPFGIAWRRKKIGGPVYPVNIMKGWMGLGEFDKTKYLEMQMEILK